MKCTQAQKIILWDKLDENMELAQKIAKNQLQHLDYCDQKQHYHHGHTMNERQFKITKKMLTKNFKQQQEKANRIHNKLAYMRLNQHKEQKALQLAKKNLVRLADIRYKSLKQRQHFTMMRKSFDFQKQLAVQAQARVVRSSRKNRQQALQKWKTIVKQTASSVRTQKNKLHTLSCQQKRQQYQLKLRQTQNVKKSLQKSRLSIQQSIQSRIQNTRQKHRNQLESRHRRLNEQKVENQKLFHVFKVQAQKISLRQSRIRKQVQLCKSIWEKVNQNPQNGQTIIVKHSNFFSDL